MSMFECGGGCGGFQQRNKRNNKDTLGIVPSNF